MCLCVTVVRLESWLSQNDILVYSLVGLQLGTQLELETQLVGSTTWRLRHHVAPLLSIVARKVRALGIS